MSRTSRWQDWPDDLRPNDSPVYTFNERGMDATPERIWQTLVRATQWPSFYGNARDVRIEDGEELGADVSFSWRTFGLRVETRVIAWEPLRALAWRGDTWYGRGMHTWLIERTPSGCHVVTEEVQAGLVPALGRLYLRRGLLHWHDKWLTGLDEAARR